MSYDFLKVIRRITTRLSVYLFIACIIVNLIAPVAIAQETEEAENLDVFWKWTRWNNPGAFLIEHCMDQADILFDKRDEQIEKIKTKTDWEKRQKWVKEKLKELMGPFPAKTPLNPIITGTIQKDGYRIEKLVYESMPGFYVTGCVFVPDNIDGKAPAILNVMGHNQEAFRAELYQLVYLNLVKKGFIVLAIDPIGQGEAVQFYDPEIGFSRVGYTVVEHNYAGNLTFLSGISLARYFTWDGIRGIDFLLSRPDVDPERIGVTGFSGGGTITSYVAAMDERVKVSIPCSWSTYSRSQIVTKGVQDAESFLYHGLKEGLSFEDLLEVRAPLPTLLTFTSRDEYLSIQGARNSFQEARQIYEAYGKGENIQLVEDDFKHWLTSKIRNRIYSFFMEHLNVEGDPLEEEVEILKEEELQVTPTGQVTTWLETRNVQKINAAETEVLLQNIEQSRQDPVRHLEWIKSRAKALSGYKEPESSDGKPFFNGRYQRDDYSVGKFAIQGEGDYSIPILLFIPESRQERYPAMLYLHPEGKVTEAYPGGQIEQLTKQGYIVAAVDMLGIGEVRTTVIREGAEDHTGILIGRSTPGLQAGDIVRVINYLKHHDKVGPKIGAISVGVMSVPLLHAAAFESSIEPLICIDALVSYRSIVMNDHSNVGLVYNDDGYWHPWEIDFSWGVAGALTTYDLPDLVAAAVPRKVVLLGLKNQLLEPASEDVIDQDMAFPKKMYTENNVPGNLVIASDKKNLIRLIDWSFK